MSGRSGQREGSFASLLGERTIAVLWRVPTLRARIHGCTEATKNWLSVSLCYLYNGQTPYAEPRRRLSTIIVIGGAMDQGLLDLSIELSAGNITAGTDLLFM